MSASLRPNGVALVLQGGGTRGAFTAGVLDVLMERGVEFPYVIGTSAGALNGVNYVSGDIGRSKFVSTELISDKRFVSFSNLFFRGGIFNFQYLFFEVPKTRCPFDAHRFFSSPTEFIVATTGMEDGLVHYFRKGECTHMYKAVAASSSLPLLAKMIEIDGAHYLDGGVVCAVPFRQALDDGMGKLVIVETRAKGYRKQPAKKRRLFLAKRMYRKYPKFLEAYQNQTDVYNADMDEIDRLEEEGKAFVIRPEYPPKVKQIEKDTDRLLSLYEHGRNVMERLFSELISYVGAAVDE